MATRTCASFARFPCAGMRDSAVDRGHAQASSRRRPTRAPPSPGRRARGSGPGSSADGRASDGSVRSTIGTANASVLPEPVGDRARTSSPASASGSASVWMRNGEWMPRAASASATGADTPSSRKGMSDKLFDSLRVRDRAASNARRRNEKANLTGRPDCRPCRNNVAVPALWPRTRECRAAAGRGHRAGNGESAREDLGTRGPARFSPSDRADQLAIAGFAAMPCSKNSKNSSTRRRATRRSTPNFRATESRSDAPAACPDPDPTARNRHHVGARLIDVDRVEKRRGRPSAFRLRAYSDRGSQLAARQVISPQAR